MEGCGWRSASSVTVAERSLEHEGNHAFGTKGQFKEHWPVGASQVCSNLLRHVSSPKGDRPSRTPAME